MRLLGILATGFMATACGLSFNPDLPQGSEDGDWGDPTSGQGATAGDGDSTNIPDLGGKDNPCSEAGLGGAGGASAGLGGKSPHSANFLNNERCADDRIAK